MADDLVARARRYAAELHEGNVRKGSGESYFHGHLEPVAMLVKAAGGTDVQIAGAYLHDAAEDHGGHRRLAAIAAEFGAEVAEIVTDLSDSLADTDNGEEKAPWRERKQAYLDSMAGKPVTSLQVAAADKVHNAQSILDDHARIGDEIWRRFTTGQASDQRWYYGELAARLEATIPTWPLTQRLAEIVARFPPD